MVNTGGGMADSTIAMMLDRLRTGLVGSLPIAPGVPINSRQWRGWWDEPNGLPWVTEDGALASPYFGSGVDFIASQIASLSFPVFRPNASGVDERIYPGPNLTDDPYPLLDRVAFWYAIVNDLILWGNAFARPGPPDAFGLPMWLEPIAADRVQLVNDQATGEILWMLDGRTLVDFGALLHMSAGNRSGALLGRSVVTQYRDMLRGVAGGDAAARKYYAAGGLPPAVITSDNPEMQQAEADQVKARWKATVGTGNREPVVIPSTYTITPIASDAEKQQLIEARTYDARLCAVILHIPPSELGLPGPSDTYSNAQQVDDAMARKTFARWANPIVAALTKMYARPVGLRIGVDWSSAMSTDRRTRALTLKTEIDAGFTTEDEARLELNKPPLIRDADPAVQQALELAKAAPSLAQSPGLAVLAQQIRDMQNGSNATPALTQNTTPEDAAT